MQSYFVSVYKPHWDEILAQIVHNNNHIIAIYRSVTFKQHLEGTLSTWEKLFDEMTAIV